MELPADNYILLSVVNTALRDGNVSFEEFCAEEGVDGEETESRLNSAGFFYDRALNAFK